MHYFVKIRIDYETAIFLMLEISVATLILIIEYLKRVCPLLKELNRMKNEIKRCRGIEKYVWRKKLRQLKILFIPFYGAIKKHYRRF